MMNFLRRSPKSPDYKRPPLRNSNGVYSPGGSRIIKIEREPTPYAKRILWIVFYTVLSLTGLLAVATLILYINCVTGIEIIPKSRELCHDLYQFLQTGKFWPLTWDYVASFVEFGRIITGWLSSIPTWIKNFDLVSWKDSIISAFITARDVIIGTPFLIYDNAGQVMRLVAKAFREFFDIGKAFAVWAFYGVLYGAFFVFELFKGVATDAFDQVSVFWEKVKGMWA